MRELLKDLTIMMLQEGLDEPSIHRVLDIIEGELVKAENRFKENASKHTNPIEGSKGEVVTNAEMKDRRIVRNNQNEVNKMFNDGTIQKHVRQTSNGELIGDPSTIKKLKKMQKQSAEAQGNLLIHKWERKSALRDQQRG